MDEKIQTESSTIDAAKAGDHEAFRDLVNTHQVAVRTFITSRQRDSMEAYDLTQEVFVTAYGKLDEFDSTRPLRPWLMGIAFNFIRRHIEKDRRIPGPAGDEVLDILDERIDQGLAGWRDTPALDALQICLMKLSEEGRHLVQRRYYEGKGFRVKSFYVATYLGKMAVPWWRFHKQERKKHEKSNRNITGARGCSCCKC